MRIFAQAPVRISLYGGGTDLSPFCDEYGGKVLSIAINLRHRCSLSIGSLGGGISSVVGALGKIGYLFELTDPKFDLIKEILRSYDLPNRQFTFVDEFDGIQSAGLGSSASAAVSMIGAFNRWLGIKQTKEEIAEKAWQMEINLGWISGKQDQYASALGGVNFIEFDKGVWHEPISRGVCEKFLPWCLLVYSGRTRHSALVQKKLRENMVNEKAIKALRAMRTMAFEGKDALWHMDYRRVGELLADSWEAKKISNPAATNERINKIFKTAYANGAIGGKVLGAGSEGHMLFVVEPEKRKQLLDALKLQEIDFGIDWNGLEVRKDWR